MRTQLFYGPLEDQFGEFASPGESGDRPLVVLIHGGFWRDQYRLDLMHPLAEDLERQGFATWNIEYRRVGLSGGGWDTTTADVAAAIDHAAAEFGEVERGGMAVIGHSAGGHLALWNASRVDAVHRPDLTVGLAPVADVVTANRVGTGRDATGNFFGGDADDVPARYAHAQPDPDCWPGRVVLIHGHADENVPIAQSDALIGRADRVELLAAVDHFDVINPAHASWQIVLDELRAT